MAAKSSKGSRIVTVLEQLEDAWKEYCGNLKQNINQHHNNIRTISTKLHQLLSSQERCCRVLLSNHRDNGLSLLFDILQYFSKIDHVICTTLLDSFLSLCTTAKRISTLIDSGILCVLTECLVRMTNTFINTKEAYQFEELFLSLHTLLNKLGSKDKRLATLARLNGAVSSSVIVLKTYDTNIKIIHPVLQVIKLYSNSAANSNILVKEGVIATLLKLIPVCGQKKLLFLRLCLDLMSILCKSKSGAKKAVSLNVIPTLLAIYQEWHRNDLRNRHLCIRKSILLIIKSCIMFGFGKKSFTNSDGYRILYFLGLEGIERKEFESLFRVLTFILRKCTKKNKIPVRNQQSVYLLLPNHNMTSPNEKTTSNTTEDSDGDNANEEGIDSNGSDDREICSSDDDIGDDADGNGNIVHADDDIVNNCDRNNSDSNIESYRQFLEELNLDEEEGQTDSTTATAATIRIPTASLESSTNSPENHQLLLSEFEDSDKYCSFLTRPTSELFEKLKKFNLIGGANNTSELCNVQHCTNAKLSDKYNTAQCAVITPSGILSAETLGSSLDEELFITTNTVEKPNSNSENTFSVSALRAHTPSALHTAILPFLPLILEDSTTASDNSAQSLKKIPINDVDQVKAHQLPSSNSDLKMEIRLSFSDTNLTIPHQRLNKSNDVDLETCGISTLSGSNLNQKISVQSSFHSSSDNSVPSFLPMERKFDEYGVEHVLEFVKIAEPVIYGHLPPVDLEPLLEKKQHLQRLMLFQDLARHVFPDRVAHRVVYDLDELLKQTNPLTPVVSLTNVQSLARVGTPLRKSQSAPKISASSRTGTSVSPLKDEILKTQPLSFESRFECGNLRKAIQIRHYEYDLVLNSDTNSASHHQWFYFQVESMEVDVEYRFNIINCEKANSQFNYGMQPVVYSVQEAKNCNPEWERMGTNVCYYRNCFSRGPNGTKTYFTATFTISFPHKNDRCFIAYHYPFTLSMLKTHICKLEDAFSQSIFKKQTLCETLGGNDVYLLTITNPSSDTFENEMDKRPYIVLTGRVHPGESNSSWIMKEIMDFLVSGDMVARQLRSIFIFKIVPMLNPDGVVNGNHRCSLTGQDLNRQWKQPDSVLHPSIYGVKSLIKTMTALNKKPFMFVDFHGHSRKKNVFMYGCQPKQQEQEKQQDNSQVEENLCGVSSYDLCSSEDKVKQFPRILGSVSPYFALQTCNYIMEKSKEATARIVGYKELGIERCYTLESTYCGMDQGEFAGYHMGTRELEDMGRSFCRALLKLAMCPDVSIYD